MTGAVLTIRQVSHVFGRREALAAVDVDMAPGTTLGLIGPDGVGKSTLLSLIAGVRRIQTGQVMVLGGDMADAGHRRLVAPRIAYMPQGLGRNLYPTLSVFENVDFFGRLFGQGKAERRRRIAELLEATGLAPFPDRPAGKLSGGMKQKLGLCCALIHDPDLLILDEPTTGVDPLSRRQFWRLIDSIRARRPGMAVLVATAYMEEAARFDQLVAMDAGAVIAAGTPAALRARTGEEDLERAFIRLLPEARRRDHVAPDIPPRVAGDGVPAIEARGLTCRFGDFTAVDGVDFAIERGEIFGFLGSNGCGKTTTMKMLTGLLPPTAGEAHLFGRPLLAGDIATRRRVGYMSQAFSLYGELTVRQNLDLHARLYGLDGAQTARRVAVMMAELDLTDAADQVSDALPLGIRQRLQLAAAVLHEPELLILDEPTSGVDPVARDRFWAYLGVLARARGVTIFISTHFMNEAARCDRISLMHAGRVLAVGTPSALAAEDPSGRLEDAFVARLAAAAGDAAGDAGGVKGDAVAVADVATASPAPAAPPRRHDPRRLWAYARRETMELLRDPIRLAFALLGPMILMLTFGFGISFDVEDLPYAVFDQDQSLESRSLAEAFAGSRYFEEHRPITSPADLDRRLADGELKLAIEIPAGFGHDLTRGWVPQVGVVLDGAMPFRAETARGYVQGVAAQHLAEMAARTTAPATSGASVTIETRFRYNQAFRSVDAIVPGVIMLMLVLIPAMMTAVGVVRETETGSIANFRATPVTRFEFLAGKQLPYFGVAVVSFLALALTAALVFGLEVKGQALALLLGAVLYVAATTAFGLLVSAFMKSQLAAIFATAIICMIPAVNFSGLLTPVSSLQGGGRLLGMAFPASWFQQISIGSFTKGLGFAELWPNHLALFLFATGFLIAAQLVLPKQER
ncbi:ribosome-associated ATPase/putative transporter RbbA [Tistrella sp. BH-R2-4]|uniref:Ribosome-associated ATPase/putative transporter RbbA n=1 Tax=Tistrella arctica TaxID=3133430 RepID=A0ABU9YH06_9PROT